jgi:hypothetical protein
VEKWKPQCNYLLGETGETGPSRTTSELLYCKTTVGRKYHHLGNKRRKRSFIGTKARENEHGVKVIK